MKKSKARLIFAIIIGVFCVAYLLITGIGDLINTKDVYTVDIGGCFEAMTVEHSINGLIPVGKDHYYLGFTEDGNSAYLIKAPKSWYSKNFKEDGEPTGASAVSLTALSKRVDSYEVRDALAEKLSVLPASALLIGPDRCLVTDYKLNAIYRIFVVVGLALIIGLGVFMTKKEEDIKSVFGKILLVLTIAWLIAFLKVII